MKIDNNSLAGFKKLQRWWWTQYHWQWWRMLNTYHLKLSLFAAFSCVEFWHWTLQSLQARYGVRTNPEPIFSVQGRTNHKPILNKSWTNLTDSKSAYAASALQHCSIGAVYTDLQREVLKCNGLQEKHNIEVQWSVHSSLGEVVLEGWHIMCYIGLHLWGWWGNSRLRRVALVRKLSMKIVKVIGLVHAWNSFARWLKNVGHFLSECAHQRIWSYWFSRHSPHPPGWHGACRSSFQRCKPFGNEHSIFYKHFCSWGNDIIL